SGWSSWLRSLHRDPGFSGRQVALQESRRLPPLRSAARRVTKDAGGGRRRWAMGDGAAGREPTREEVDKMPGAVVLEFGAWWCPHCQAIQPHMAAQHGWHSEIRHIVVEDGPGRPLGRSFRVKLWPTLVFLRDGQLVRQLVRPSPEEITEAFRATGGQ